MEDCNPSLSSDSKRRRLAANTFWQSFAAVHGTYLARCPCARIDMVILCCGRSEVNVEQVQEPTPELLYFIRIEREWTWDGLQEVSSKSVKNLGE